jgi:Ca2+-binding EF-hand superfamily protein
LIIAAGASSLALGSAAFGQTVPAKPVTRAEFVAKLDQGFNTLDTNHDGSLSVSELKAAQDKELQQVQALRQDRILSEFKQLDTNKDGQLSLAEFAAAVPGVKPTETAAQILQKFDANKDGKVTAEEFRAPRVAMFNKVDANHDGTITPEEARKAQGGK